ncbi:hypothetical protein ACFQU1_18735 [Chelatococcus sp. GCM10030263]
MFCDWQHVETAFIHNPLCLSNQRNRKESRALSLAASALAAWRGDKRASLEEAATQEICESVAAGI